MEKLSQDAFSENLNSRFTANLGDAGTVDLELTECKDLGSTPRQEQFSILFRGPLQPFLQQMTYQLSHEKLGETLIFLVPVKQDSDSTYYEAIFNRFVEQDQ